MIINRQLLLITTTLITLATPSIQAEEGLGRLFTTPQERALLEKMRVPTPKPEAQTYDPIVVIDHSKFEPPKSKYTHDVTTQFDLYPDPDPVVKQVTQSEVEIVIIPTPVTPRITVNGFVKRSGGRSTAWVNGINTNDGYFDPQHIKVNPHRIGRDHVHVEADDINIGDVSLKVGQTLDPKAGKITEIYQEVSGKSNSK